MKYVSCLFIILFIFLATPDSLLAANEYLDTTREIRIGLTLLGNPHKMEVISSNSILEIISPKSNKILFNGKIKNLTISAKKAGAIYIDLGENKILASSPILLTNRILPAKSDNQISLKPNGKKLRSYRGKIEISSRWQELSIVNIIDMEEYLQSVVPSEISTRSPKAAQEAQAIAARTYAVRNIDRHCKKGNYNLCDKVHCQAYFGTIKESESSNSAIKATLGKILSYNCSPANTVYHSNCGGYIISSQTAWGGKAVPYLVGHFDGIKGYKPFCEYGKQYLYKKNKFDLPAKSKKLVIGVTEANSRKKTHNNFGHRVGMCQDGAIGMAAIGYNCSNILGFYYPRTKIETLKYAGKGKTNVYQATNVTTIASGKQDKNSSNKTSHKPEIKQQPAIIASTNKSLHKEKVLPMIASESIVLANNSKTSNETEPAQKESIQMEGTNEQSSGIKHVLKVIGTAKPNYTSNAIKKLFWSQTTPSISTEFTARAARRRKR